MGRLDAIRTAERPKMHGRAMLSGPSGAGKTWTALSMARVLTSGDMSQVLVIDTEHESALTYADVFLGFKHLPWTPPFDAGELAQLYGNLGSQYAVVITDSFSHFWRGQGGILDLADGKIGGWKTARPVQDALVQAVLAVPAHMFLCVRSKMDYLIEKQSGGKQEVTKLGIAPIQDETLVYEMNIALDIDLEHRITVTKSRTPAVPVGRMYPAGLEGKAAQDYADWLAGGVPPAAREVVEAIVARFGDIADADRRKAIKAEFVQLFGMPHSLTAEKMPAATAWLEAQLGTDPDDTTPNQGEGSDGAPTEGMPAQAAATGAGEAPAQITPAGDAPEPEPAPPAAPPPPQEPAAAAAPAADGPTFRDRLLALPQDLADSVREANTAILARGVAEKSPEHVAEATQLLSDAEKAQAKRAKDIAVWLQAIGIKDDDDRHQVILTVTAGDVASARKVTAAHHKAIRGAIRDHQNGVAFLERHDDGTYRIREAVAS